MSLGRASWLGLLIVVGLTGVGRGQMGGGALFGQGGGKARAQQAERARRNLNREAMPPSPTTAFLEASVLMNVPADEYVAVFGLSTEGPTAEACREAMGELVSKLAEAVRGLGIGEGATNVDFVAQNRSYGFAFEGDVAREKVAGIELKETFSVRFEDRALLDRLLVAAARLGIHDLIKVDYVVKDVGAVEDRLMEEAARVIARKRERHQRLLGVVYEGPPQVYAEQYAAYYPTDMYESYVAAETEEISTDAIREKYTVQRARKSRTFHYSGLDADGFDAVIHPAPLEPRVQFTLHLKVKHEIARAPAP
jgi:uncharacterized protein YggE